jgi:NAD-dependent deacetylase
MITDKKQRMKTLADISMDPSYFKAAEMIQRSEHITAFTGAGISVPSGIPPFRGADGLWSRYDPNILQLHRYLYSPEKSWPVIKEIFYDYFGKARPNPAHFALANMELQGLKTIITQNIDNLHQEAGSADIIEFHGSSHWFTCTGCSRKFPLAQVSIEDKAPHCSHCAALLKPDFIFFGEAIPEAAMRRSLWEAKHSQLFLVIGTTGEIYPASQIPHLAAQNGIPILEINPEPSAFTHSITNHFIQEKAEIALPILIEILKNHSKQ